MLCMRLCAIHFIFLLIASFEVCRNARRNSKDTGRFFRRKLSRAFVRFSVYSMDFFIPSLLFSLWPERAPCPRVLVPAHLLSDCGHFKAAPRLNEGNKRNLKRILCILFEFLTRTRRDGTTQNDVSSSDDDNSTIFKPCAEYFRIQMLNSLVFFDMKKS